jgi:hypothetical protein
MANIGAQPGNKNAAKGRMFADAINRALQLPGRHERLKRLEAIADKLVTLAEDGDIQAIREVADRLDGKPAQTIQGDGDAPLVFRVEAPWMTPAVAERNE